MPPVKRSRKTIIPWGGGAALSRRIFGERLGGMDQNFPHWLCDNCNQYDGNENALPVDQHMQIALIAPRPVYIASAEEDKWADPKGEYLSGYNNDRQYYKEHLQYHMYLHPEYPSHEDQIRARDNLLLKHPDLHFMGAHLGSLEWSVDELARHFDMLPNMTVDMAARVCHIEKQVQTDWQKVHDFFIKYQDRIIYGTDQGDWEGAEADTSKLKAATHEVWFRDWKFLTSDEPMTSWEVNGEFRGLRLPREVIEKIYRLNAMKWFPEV